SAERHMKHGAILRAIDPLAAEHGIDPLPQPGFIRELNQKLQRFIGDPVLGVIEIDTRRVQGQTPTPVPIFREQISQMPSPYLLAMYAKTLPGRTLGEPAIGERS